MVQNLQKSGYLFSFLDLLIVTIYFAEIGDWNKSSKAYFQVVMLRFFGIGENSSTKEQSWIQSHYHFPLSPFPSTLTTDLMTGLAFSMPAANYLVNLQTSISYTVPIPEPLGLTCHWNRYKIHSKHFQNHCWFEFQSDFRHFIFRSLRGDRWDSDGDSSRASKTQESRAIVLLKSDSQDSD